MFLSIEGIFLLFFMSLGVFQGFGKIKKTLFFDQFHFSEKSIFGNLTVVELQHLFVLGNTGTERPEYLSNRFWESLNMGSIFSRTHDMDILEILNMGSIFLKNEIEICY